MNESRFELTRTGQNRKFLMMDGTLLIVPFVGPDQPRRTDKIIAKPTPIFPRLSR